MKFEQALQAMREGKKVRRCIDSLINFQIVDGKIMSNVVNSYGEYVYGNISVVSCADIMLETWEIVEDEPQS